MSAAVMPAPAAIYREEQYFGWWVYGLLAGMFVVGGFGVAWAGGAGVAPRGGVFPLPLISTVGLALPGVLVVGVLRMTTEVRPDRVRVWFGWVPCYRKDVPLESIQGYEIVQYRPLADYGGWGVRFGRDGERVLSARGDRGVRLLLVDDTRLLVGSQRPEELAAALEKMLNPN